jgi:hypothetical protein
MATNRVYGAITLIGGAAGALDSIDGTDLIDKDMAITFVSGVTYFYSLDADSAAAESSPNVIKPDANAGDKRWVLQNLAFETITATDLITAENCTVTDTLTAATVDLNSGAIDATVIGASSQAAGDFTAIGAVSAGTIVGTTIDANTDFTVGSTVITDGVITDATGLQLAADVDITGYITFDGAGAQVAAWSGADVTGITGTAGTTNYPVTFNADGDLVEATVLNFNSINLTNIDIDSGTIDGATIGASSASTIVGTTIDASTDFTIGSTVITDGIITDATGLSLAANVSLTGSLTLPDAGKQIWDAAPASDDTCSGDISSETVDTNAVGIGAVLVLSADGNWDEADQDAEATVGLLGMAVESGTGTKNVMHNGWIHLASHGFTVGAQLFVSDTQGTMTNTVPGTGKFAQICGYAVDANTIRFNPSPDYIEVS